MARKATFAAALDEAVAEEMRRDERVYFMSTLPPAPLLHEFGPERVRQTPISELAVSGIAVGSAACGFRPIAHWRSVTFSFVAFDQVINQAAKMRYMLGGQRDFPIVFRAACGGGAQVAAQHSQSPYSIFAHIAGIKVILPSGAADAKGLMKSAIRDNNPVVSFEGVRLDPMAEEIPDGEHVVPLGSAAVKREGKDVTIVALAYMVPLALQAAEDLAAEGISVEVVDPRTLAPLDVETIRQSVRKTRRLIIADEAPPACSVASEIAAASLEDRETFRALRGPVRRVCGAPVPIPYSPPLESFVLPDKARIAAAIRAAVAD